MGLLSSIKGRFTEKGPDTSKASGQRGKRSGKRIRNPSNDTAPNRGKQQNRPRPQNNSGSQSGPSNSPGGPNANQKQPQSGPNNQRQGPPTNPPKQNAPDNTPVGSDFDDHSDGPGIPGKDDAGPGPNSGPSGPNSPDDPFGPGPESSAPQQDTPGGQLDAGPQGHNPPQNRSGTQNAQLDMQDPSERGKPDLGGPDSQRSRGSGSPPRDYNFDLPRDEPGEQSARDIKGELHQITEQNERIIDLLRQIKNGMR